MMGTKKRAAEGSEFQHVELDDPIGSTVLHMRPDSFRKRSAALLSLQEDFESAYGWYQIAGNFCYL